MKIKVEKITKNKATYRTPLSKIDTMPAMPVVGHPLLLGSSTYKSGGILTSTVLKIEMNENQIVVKTQFSTYNITILES